MDKILFIFCIVCSANLLSQTHSTLINPFDNIYNNMRSMVVGEDVVYISTEHFCSSETSGNSLISCTGLISVTLDGEIVKSVLIDSMFPEGFNRLVYENSKVYLSGHHHEEFLGRSTYLYEFSSDSLNINSIIELENNHDEIVNNNGILVVDTTFIFYGSTILGDNSHSDIRSVNIAEDISTRTIISRGLIKNDCHDLQSTINGNLVYANSFKSNGDSGQQIMVLDSSFSKVDSIEFDNTIQDRSGVLRILASSSGHIYCMTNNHPFGSRFPAHGHINKFTRNLDTLEWSVKLPFNNLINERRYLIHDFYEAQNGDILASGRAWDSSPSALLDQVNNGFNGFLARLSPDGEIKFLRVYKLPHLSGDLLPEKDFGIYHETSLWNIHELEDGRIVLGGIATYNSLQLSVILPNDEVLSYPWMLVVQNDGCLVDEECQEVIVVDGIKNDGLPIFPLGTRWTYDFFPNPINPNTIETSYITFEVVDTIIQND